VALLPEIVLPLISVSPSLSHNAWVGECAAILQAAMKAQLQHILFIPVEEKKGIVDKK
jgi:hypothetical protein